MSFKLSLDDVEPWKGGGVILRTGTHPIRVVDEEIKLDGDHPVVVVTLQATGGDEKGGEIRDWIHVTEASLGRVAQIYEAFQVKVPSGEFEWIPLKGKAAKAVVREKPGRDDPSKSFSEVAAYTALTDADVVDGVKEAFGGTEVSGGSDGKDIPF